VLRRIVGMASATDRAELLRTLANLPSHPESVRSPAR